MWVAAAAGVLEEGALGWRLVDQNRFLQYVEECLLPTLGNYERGEPRSVVVMDNARVHKHPRLLELIRSVGAKLVWNAA